MRLILVFVAVISAGTSALTRGHSHHRPPVRNQLRRSGPFHHHYHGHIQNRGHNTQHHRPSPSPSPRFQRSQFSHHNAYITPYPTQTLHQLGGAGGVNYGYVAGGSNNDHGQSFGGGQILNSLTQAFSPVQPPILSVSPIIPYEPESELPGSHHHEHHGQNLKISKSIYVFSAPPDQSDNVRPHIVKTFPQQKQKHYQVLFINAPPPPLPPQHTVELPQPPELKTQIYVLVKKPQPAPPVKIIPSKVPVNKPEVYFIRYKNNQDASDGYAPVPSDVPIIYPQSVPHDDVLNHHSQPPQPDDLVYQNIQHQHEEFLHPQPQPGGEYVETTPPQEYIPVLTDNPHQHPNPNHLEYINAPQEHHQHPHHPQQLIEHYGGQAPADPYSDYSRLSAHYTTVTGRPISLLSPSPSLSKNKVKKLRIKHKSQISRIDDDDNWTPLISNRSNDNNNKKKQELDAGMSGI